MKRFQECNILVKFWRYRHYLYIPFKWVWFKYFKPFNVVDDITNESEKINGLSIRKLFKSYFDSIKKIGIFDSTKLLFNGGLIRCDLWKLLIGIAQCDMNWTYTMEEVKKSLRMD
jgi:hypothetical protein